MSSRREVLLAAAGLAAGRVLQAANPMHVHLGCQTNAWAIDPRDFGNVLAIVRKIENYGYEGFETGFANVQGQFGDPAAAKAKLDSIGLQFIGVHIFLLRYDPATHVAPAELYERVAAGGAKLGAERLILSGAPPQDEAGRKRKAEALNRAGSVAQKLGLKLAYHNHGPEFASHGEEIEFLLRETDPVRVWFLLDAGHAFVAGADIPAFIRKHHDRLTGMHLRDSRDGKETPLGTGDFPLEAVAAVIRETGWSGWVINEEERVGGKPGDEAIKPARDALFRVFRGEA
ncbi:MAG: sugar phosphate isomerase/epimerase family protein [Bryobacteraceae bacterium]